MAILPGLAGVVDAFALPGGISIERTTSDVVDGYPTASAPVVSAISPAVVHIASGRDLLKLVEGDRTKEAIAVFTKVRLRTALEGSNEMPDVVLYTSQGVQRRYVVKVSEDWIEQSGHYRCLCVKEENG